MSSESTQFQDERLWRYMDHASFMWTLLVEKIHLHRSDEFEDPFEGTTPSALIERRNEESSVDASANDSLFERHIELQRKATFLNCWHSNPRESAAMWNQYATEDKGIAITTTRDQLIESMTFPDVGEHSVSEVSYVDFDSGFEDLESSDQEIIESYMGDHGGMNTKELHFLKRKEFSHENEVRVSVDFDNELRGNDIDKLQQLVDVSEYENTDSSIYDVVPVDTGFNVPIEIPTLIDRIYLSPKTPDWLEDSITEAVRNMKDDITTDQIYHSNLSDDPRF